MSTLPVPGGTLNYTTAGARFPLCVTHQYNEVSVEDPLVRPLTAFFACYAINPRGIAGSGAVHSAEDLTMLAHSDDLQAAKNALGITRWIVAGASTGGMVALLYAIRYPQSIAGLILIDTAASYRFVKGSLF